MSRSLPAGEVLSVEETFETKFRDADVPQQELSTLGDFDLNADMPDRFLDAADRVRRLAVDDHCDLVADDRDVERVPLADFDQAVAFGSRQVADVSFFAFQQIGLIAALRERSTARQRAEVNAGVVVVRRQRLPLDVQLEVGIDVMRPQPAVAVFEPQQAVLNFDLGSIFDRPAVEGFAVEQRGGVTAVAGFRGSRLIGEQPLIEGVKARGRQQGRAQNKSSHGCFSGTRGGFNRPNTRSRILPVKHVAVPSRRRHRAEVVQTRKTHRTR